MYINSYRRAHKGFTLAELLIALAILGVIATFTIPKILSAQANGQNTAIAKEAASMINAAFITYTLNNTMATGVTAGAITQYMNYVAVDSTTTNYTGTNGTGLQTCVTYPCLKLHNGGILQYDTAQSFANNTTGSIQFNLDPDGNGPQGRVTFVQFYGGRLSTGQQAGAASTAYASSGGGLTNQTTDPSYLQNWN